MSTCPGALRLRVQAGPRPEAHSHSEQGLQVLDPTLPPPPSAGQASSVPSAVRGFLAQGRQQTRWVLSSSRRHQRFSFGRTVSPQAPAWRLLATVCGFRRCRPYAVPAVPSLGGTASRRR